MAETTRNLALPLLAAAQAQKHVTHNEALALLDALVQLACLDKDLAAPPASPAEGDRYLVTAAAPTGAWSGLSGQVALFADGVWTGSVPRPGWLAYVADEGALYVFTAAGWTSLGATVAALQNLTRLGIGTVADAANPLSAKLGAALFTAKAAAEGGSGDLRITLNKEASARTLSLLFQTGYSGRAELGLAGEDALSAKVSADGAAWTAAWRADPATGYVGFGAAASGTPGAPVSSGVVSAAPAVEMASHAATGAPEAMLRARIGRGSPSAPAGIKAGDRLFTMAGRGYHAGGAYSGDTVSLGAFAEEDFTGTAQGTGLDFQTVASGTTVRRSVLRLRANGAVEMQPRAGAPIIGAGAGQIVFDSTATAFKVHDGTRWSRLSNLVRFAAATGFDNYIAADTWTKVQFNTGTVNDQGAFDAGTNRFVAPEAGTYTFGASLAYRRNGTSSPTGFQARFHRNGAAAGSGRAGAANPADGVTALGATATLALQAGDAVEVFALFNGADGYVAAAESGFWGHALP